MNQKHKAAPSPSTAIRNRTTTEAADSEALMREAIRFAVKEEVDKMYQMHGAPPCSPSMAYTGRNISKTAADDPNALFRETVRSAVKEEVEDDKKVNNQRNKLTKRHIIGLSVALAVFGLLCVGAGAYLNYWIHVESGMSKYMQVK